MRDNIDFVEDLYSKYYVKLFRLAKSMIKSDAVAEELVSEAFVILLVHIDELREHPNPLGWLYVVLTNLARNALRRQKQRKEISLEEMEEIGEDPEMIPFPDTLPNELNAEEKRILKLRYEDQLNCVEIAQELGISHDSSRMRLHRARKHCKYLMQREQKKCGD